MKGPCQSGTEPCKAILEVGFPVSISRIHTAYIGLSTSILGT